MIGKPNAPGPAASLIIFLFLCWIALPAQADEYELGKAAWQGGDYRSAYEHLRVHRTQPGGRTAEVDYMLGTSACRFSDQDRRVWGRRVLEWMLYAYPLTEESRSKIVSQRDLCAAGSTTEPVAVLVDIATDISAQAGMRARGKEYYWVRPGSPISTYAPRKVRDIDRSEFVRRLTPLGEEDEGLRKLRTLVPGAKGVGSPHFLLATTGSHSKRDLNEIAAVLEKFWAFLLEKLDIPPRPDYISVFLVPRTVDLEDLAADLHGLGVNRSTMGYSFRDDLSVVGVVPAYDIGTLFHELSHLAFHTNFGDIPQWLDEGIAGLYEVSEVSSDGVLGLPNWRGEVLRRLWDERPSLRLVIQSPWLLPDRLGEAESEESETHATMRVAVHNATARYFCLYLQDTGKLWPVYRAFRDHDLGGDWKSAPQYALELAERALGRDLTEVEAEFDDWLSQKVKRRSSGNSELSESRTATADSQARPNSPLPPFPRKELADALATESGLSNQAAEEVLDTLFGDSESEGILAKVLAQGRKVDIDGFGEFSTKQVSPRTGRNPATGSEITFGRVVRLVFHPDKKLKDYLTDSIRSPTDPDD